MGTGQVSSNSYFGIGKVQGVPGAAVDFDKFEQSATPKFAIGYKVEDSDGAVYRYCHFGAAVNRGVLCAQDISESSLGDSDDVIVASASCTDTTDGLAGSFYLEITAGDGGSTIAANAYSGGKFITSDDAGEGYTYDIVGNTASTSTSGATFRLQLKQAIQVAVTAATDFIIVGNKYANLEIATAATDNFVAGVSCRSMTIAYYGWVQTKGVVGILCETTGGTDAIGDKVVISSVDSGAVTSTSSTGSATQTADQLIGTVVVAGDDTGHGAYSIDV